MALRMFMNFSLKYSDRSREGLESTSSPLRPDKPKNARDLPFPETGFIVHTFGPKPVHIGSMNSIMIGMLFTVEEIRNYYRKGKTYMSNVTSSPA